MQPGEKRHRSDAGFAMETDFTALFASKKQPMSDASTMPTQSQSQQPLQSVEPRDSCGFCKEGTYCVCADAANMASSLPAPSNLPVTQQTHTPPPSEDDVVPMAMEVTATGAIKLPRLQSHQSRTNNMQQSKPAARTGGKCGPNGPGTCAQCLADPKSGLFCRSLAANFERNNRQQGEDNAAGGCCGKGGPGGCCKGGNPADTATSGTSSDTGLGLSLSCAEAYKTLASHRHFDEAADDIASWLPKLRAIPIPQNLGQGRGHITAGRAPIEVEAASIMSVLKGFDVRFGRGE